MEKRSLIFVCALTLSFFLINNYLFDHTAPPAEPVVVAEKVTAPPLVQPMFVSSSSSDESFYVLENNYGQFVFSTLGGALAEINLPFATKTNKSSVVLPIQFDKSIEKQSAQNDQFPLNSYTSFENGSLVKKDPKLGGYTPLLRRSLKGKDGSNLSSISPSYYALNILSPEFGVTSYRVNHMGKDFIEFVGKDHDRTITKTYRIPKETPYTIELQVSIDGNANNLWVTSGLLEVELVSGSYSPLLQYYALSKNKGGVEKLKLPKTDFAYPTLEPLWVSNGNGFFGTIIDPTNTAVPGVNVKMIPGESAPSRLTLIDSAYNLYPAKDYPTYEFLIPCKPVNTPLKFVMFAGPYEGSILNAVDTALSNPETGIGGNPHFAKALTFQGWFTFITEPFAKFLFIIMQFFYFITHSWGISIILLTFILRVMLYPLNAWSYKSTVKMQKVGPKLEAIKEKFKSDPKRLQTETAMLYKTEGVNPFSGCLPILIQLPFLIGMFDLLKTTFALRGVGFIPGWIENLTAPDILFSWHYPIMFFGTDFHLLPFILGALMYLQQKVSSVQQGTKGPMTEQQQQLKTMGSIMTIAFTFMFYNMPSGLNIYWIFSTLFGMLQQWFMMTRFQKNPNVLKS